MQRRHAASAVDDRRRLEFLHSLEHFEQTARRKRPVAPGQRNPEAGLLKSDERARLLDFTANARQFGAQADDRRMKIAEERVLPSPEDNEQTPGGRTDGDGHRERGKEELRREADDRDRAEGGQAETDFRLVQARLRHSRTLRRCSSRRTS